MATVCSEDMNPLLEEFSIQADSLSLDRKLDAEAERLRAVLVLGVSLAISIDVIDANWRKAVLGGIDEYDPAQEKWILDCHRAWLRGAGKVAICLDRLESRDVEVGWSGLFRRLYRESKALLTPDDQFFGGDALIGIRDDAIDSHREGRTAEFHELGD